MYSFNKIRKNKKTNWNTFMGYTLVILIIAISVVILNVSHTAYAATHNNCTQPTLDSSNCQIINYLLKFINALSAVVGVVVVIMIIVGGIQYSSAGDDPQKVQAAKTKITNALLALLVFIFMFAFLQWVVPGGIF